ncbi:DUF5007 domain-containing protein [Sphingobacterium sp. SGG-5]|nr:DUF5007 domain-containing protein [Sphingobacterium sp. SGG-5]
MKRILYLLLVCISVALAYSCKKNFPQDLNAFSLDMNFTQKEYQPTLGRSTVYQGNFNSGESSLPLSFRISAVRTFDGKPAPELLKLFPVSIWTGRYTGEEKSLEEIRAKRDTVMRPLWEIGEHSGTLTMWETANSNILKVFPDSGYVFDVEVQSSGGRRYFRDLKLKPQIEEPYSLNGLIISGGMLGEETRTPLEGRINVWFNRVGDGSSITFKVLRPDLTPIPLNKFNTTDWENMLHGFNMRFAPDYSSVTYDVEYPIPLVSTIPTKYTANGNAYALFTFDRISYGGIRSDYGIGFPFSIYQRGDWEVIFYFYDEAPLFEND